MAISSLREWLSGSTKKGILVLPGCYYYSVVSASCLHAPAIAARVDKQCLSTLDSREYCNIYESYSYSGPWSVDGYNGTAGG